MFIGRHRELATLQRRWNTNAFECVVVYGRRRVGKTTLINEFLNDRPTIFFSAIESSESRNLEALSRSIALFEKGDAAMESAPIFRNFEEALHAVFELARTQRIAFVIDEYPYLAKADRSANSVLQHAIDRHKDDSRLMLILCGSSMSFMERQVLGYESPLYGRRTAQIKVEPFGYTDVRRFLPRFSAEDAAIAYGLTDGIPQYLNQIDDSMTIRDNIRWNIIDPDCYLFEEPDNLLKQELRNPAEYNAIIQAIASGASRSNTIATACHMETSNCSTYLRNLIDLGIVRKETPFQQDSPRKTIYRIEDSFFRFWYRFVPINMSLIQSGRSDLATDRIMRSITDFMGQVFEDICTQWLWMRNGTDDLPFLLLQTGRWWGADPRTRRQEEIDIVGSGEDPKQMLFCECKWRSIPSGMRELETLQHRADLLHANDNRYMLFAKSGFDEPVRNAASNDAAITLVSFDDM
ncbi:ATP-binding protein [Bifidobacterium callitrichos]|uniref:ATP-binding protein n=1 Tax=Bifidobacterium callitrichos TaxID=762209 RepID=A0A5M9ZEN2_9BIFI|nr:ATP-binding protein [Bifidobacterium callitrichos]KAA8816574.1 ATP-binding protein [Bifidobacterium callitrichos]